MERTLNCYSNTGRQRQCSPKGHLATRKPALSLKSQVLSGKWWDVSCGTGLGKTVSNSCKRYTGKGTRGLCIVRFLLLRADSHPVICIPVQRFESASYTVGRILFPKQCQPNMHSAVTEVLSNALRQHMRTGGKARAFPLVLEAAGMPAGPGTSDTRMGKGWNGTEGGGPNSHHILDLFLGLNHLHKSTWT